jgi:hypothetical protein
MQSRDCIFQTLLVTHYHRNTLLCLDQQIATNLVNQRVNTDIYDKKMIWGKITLLDTIQK